LAAPPRKGWCKERSRITSTSEENDAVDRSMKEWESKRRRVERGRESERELESARARERERDRETETEEGDRPPDRRTAACPQPARAADCAHVTECVHRVNI
jgi:hypothetical protein